MRALLIGLVVAGCVGNTSTKFQLLVSDNPIELVAPTTVLVQVLVVNAPSPEVTITSSNLPAFATISGDTIELKPGVADAGDYAIDLVATSGGDTATGTLRLHITPRLDNTGPMWLPVPYFTGGSSAMPAQIRAPVCDKEHDNFTFEVSVALTGSPIPNTPDFTHFIDFALITPIMMPDRWCADFVTPLPGLAPGDYRFTRSTSSVPRIPTAGSSSAACSTSLRRRRRLSRFARRRDPG